MFSGQVLSMSDVTHNQVLAKIKLLSESVYWYKTTTIPEDEEKLFISNTPINIHNLVKIWKVSYGDINGLEYGYLIRPVVEPLAYESSMFISRYKKNVVSAITCVLKSESEVETLIRLNTIKVYVLDKSFISICFGNNDIVNYL